jgi:hypothetical protein
MIREFGEEAALWFDETTAAGASHGAQTRSRSLLT